MRATVQAVLAARIDRLAERERGVLQTAALIGKEFPLPILERVADLPARELSVSLAGLERAEFIFERSLYPELEYAFRHPLTQEVALHSQLSDRRRRVQRPLRVHRRSPRGSARRGGRGPGLSLGGSWRGARGSALAPPCGPLA